ncbi:MAG: PatB family C-S lyase [Bacillota bacterium]
MNPPFDEIIPRENTSCVKYDARGQVFGNPKVDPLWVADMDFATPEFIREALEKRMTHPIFGYSFREESFYQSTLDWLKNRHQWDIERSSIHYSPGIVQGLMMAARALTRPGDQIIIQPPVYPPFFDLAGRDRTLLLNPLSEKDGHYTMDLDHLASIITPKSRLLVLCNPHNPVGRVWGKAELSALSALCEKHSLSVLSDEIHADILFAPHRHCPYALSSEAASRHSITFVSPAKTFNIAGLPAASFICSNPELQSPVLQQMKDFSATQGNLLGHIAYTTAYQQGESWRKELLAYLGENLKTALQWAETAPAIRILPPEATYLLWLDFRKTGLSDREISHKLTHEAGVGLNPGTSFGKEGTGFQRLNIACPRKKLIEALEKISRVF